MVNFNEFLDIVIDRQGDAHDIYDEIMQGFKMFDIGNRCQTHMYLQNSILT